MANTDLGGGAGAAGNEGDGNGSSQNGKQQGSGDSNNAAFHVDDKGGKFYPEKHVTGLYDENAKARLKNKELTEKLKAIEDAQAEAERLRLEQAGEHKKLADEADKRAKKAEKAAQEVVENVQRKAIKTAVRAELIREGILDPDDVALLDLSKVTWDGDSDEPSGIEAIVTAFKKSKPAKFKGDGDGDGGNGNGNSNEQKRRANMSAPGSNGPPRTNTKDYRDRSIKDDDVNADWNAKFVKQ